jgi:hypothetical protein
VSSARKDDEMSKTHEYVSLAVISAAVSAILYLLYSALDAPVFAAIVISGIAATCIASAAFGWAR